MQKHFPAVCEDTASSLHRSLLESRMEGGNGRRTPLLLSSLTWQIEQRTLLQALHSWLCHQSQRGTSHGRGVERRYWNSAVINPARRLGHVENLAPSPVLHAYSVRSSPFHANRSTCRSLFQMITRNNLEDSKSRCYSWFCSFPPCTAAAPRTPNCCPHCTEGADSMVQFQTLFCLLIHDHIVMQLQHFWKKI